MKRMHAVTLTAAWFALMPAAAAMAQAQTGGPTPAASAQPDQARPVSPQRARGGGGADARHCLKFDTNMEVHRCAERYRRR
jgi:hypothetical protein